MSSRKEPAVFVPAFYLCADVDRPHQQLPALWAALQRGLVNDAPPPPQILVAAPLDFHGVTDLAQGLTITGPPHRLLHIAADLVATGGSAPRRSNAWDVSCWADVDTALGDGWLRIHVARDLAASEANPQHRPGPHWPPPESRRHVVMALRLPLDLGQPDRVRLQILRPRPCYDKPARPLHERFEAVPHHLAAGHRAAILNGAVSNTSTPAASTARGYVRIPDGALVVLPS